MSFHIGRLSVYRKIFWTTYIGLDPQFQRYTDTISLSYRLTINPTHKKGHVLAAEEWV